MTAKMKQILDWMFFLKMHSTVGVASMLHMAWAVVGYGMQGLGTH